MTARDLLNEMIHLNASDLHIAVGNYPMFRLHGSLQPMENLEVLTENCTASLIRQLVGDKQYEQLDKTDELDCAISHEGGYRIRINAYRQQKTLAAAIRLLPNKSFRLEELGLPMKVLDEICNLHSGLILVTGATSSGKSTTIASIVNQINHIRPCHIHTIEDPIEYEHVSKKAFVTQREVGRDTSSFAEALRRSMREDPDVIVIGEMRDTETMAAALTLAETGHITFATLHTSSAAQTLSRVISAFPANQQAQTRIQLASTLEYVISQQLIPWDNNQGRSLVAEVLKITPAVRAMIREEKTHQIKTAMQTGHELGMRTMDQSLEEIIKAKLISQQTAMQYSSEKKIG